jgi:Fe-S-cluster-containing hydrogenase component 2
MTNQVSTIEFQKSGVLEFYADLCVGCGACMLMCSLYHEGIVSPSLARIRMDRDPLNAEYLRYVDPSYCTACDECYYACPFEPKRVHRYEKDKKAYKCDLCMGREEGPICVEYCPVDALALIPAEEKW